MIKYPLVLTLLLAFSKVLAQQPPLQEPKWEVGVNLLSLLKPPSLRLDQLNSTYGLIVRKKVSPKNALRFRSDFGLDFDPSPTVPNTNQPRDYTLSFDIGYERQNRVGRFVHYYGGDVMIRFSGYNSTIGIGIANGTDPSALTYTTQKGKVRTIGLEALTGGKYYMADRVSLSLETNLQLSIASTIGETFNIDGNGNKITNPVTIISSSGMNLNIVPISVIYLSYYF